MAHTRHLEGISQPFERPVLAWLARHMPGWVTPDHLTVLGILGAALTSAGYVGARYAPATLEFACLGLVINWLGDSLDGTLARYRRIERPRYGFFVDHTSDILSQSMIILGLGASPYLRFDLACLVLSGYIATAAFSFIRMQVNNVLQISYFGVGPTEMRALLLVLTLAVLASGPSRYATPLGPLSLLDGVALFLLAAVVVSLALLSLDDLRKLAREEPPVAWTPGELHPRESSVTGHR